MQWNSENLIGNKYARGGHGGGGGTRGDCEVSELEEERELALQWTGEAEARFLCLDTTVASAPLCLSLGHWHGLVMSICAANCFCSSC